MVRIFKIMVFAIFLAYNAFAQNVEVRIFHDEDSTVVKEIYFIDSSAKLNGSYVSFFFNGIKEKEGYYSDNLPDSLWTYFYESGQTKMKGMLLNGSNHGFWQYFYENGMLQMAGEIIDAKRQGSWKYYYENGNIKSEGKYIENAKSGVWNYFYEEGQLKGQAFYAKDKGTYKEFYTNGKLKAEGVNANSQRDSTWVYYHENGKIQSTGDYLNGKREGIWKYYFDNGQLASVGDFLDGKKDGKWVYYHENGEISSEGALREGKREGYWRIFSENGSFKAEGIFENNNGKYTEYYEGGALKAQGNILDGKNHGLWIYYFEDGKKEGECEFVHGGGEYTGYYEDGSIKMKGTIQDGVNVGLWKLYKNDGDLAGYYRPYYENDKPIYKLATEKKPKRGDYIKPAYKYKSNKSRYFEPVVNEFKGFVVATNPLATIFGQLPLAVEYYIEERLGYEIQFTALRNPFFTPSENVEINKNYSRGFNVSLKQKFYHPEGKIGTMYFGHELRFTSLNHYANVIDSSSMHSKTLQINAQEKRIEYAVIIGDRFIQLMGNRHRNNSLGFTIDGFLGFGIGYRMYTKNYPENPTYDLVFNSLNESNFVISPRIGLNIGFVFR